MPISEWWSQDPEQRFWMEATDRDVLGEDLRAPKTGGDGQPVWHYELVSLVKPGDVVFHWHTTLLGHPALVGWSIALGPLHEELYPWTAHAGVNAAQAALPRPNWIMPLGGVNYFANPVTNADLREIRSELLALVAELKEHYTGFRYFPFNKYRAKDVRASQAYLTKLPMQLVHLLVASSGLDFDITEVDDASTHFENAAPPAQGKGGQGHQQDTARRLAIERHALDRSLEVYAALGAVNPIELGKPYDISVELDGTEIHIEVKGSSGHADSVLVTSGEIDHAKGHPNVELVVVDQIEWSVEDDGTVHTFGGRTRRWTSWLPTPESLEPKTYKHTLPAKGQEITSSFGKSTK
jgi:hypothetical protein